MSFLYSFAASDIDIESFGEVRFFITAGNLNDHTFVLEDTGILRIANALDFDTVPMHNLTIQAIDNEGEFTNRNCNYTFMKKE